MGDPYSRTRLTRLSPPNSAVVETMAKAWRAERWKNHTTITSIPFKWQHSWSYHLYLQKTPDINFFNLFIILKSLAISFGTTALNKCNCSWGAAAPQFFLHLVFPVSNQFSLFARVHENSVTSILVASKISSRCCWKWATLKDYHQTTATCHFTKFPQKWIIIIELV